MTGFPWEVCSDGRVHEHHHRQATRRPASRLLRGSAMTEFSRRVNVELFRDDAMTREEFVEFNAVDGAPAEDVDTAYERYLHYLQPFWWHAQSPNGEILTNGERYVKEAGAINSIELLFGDDTTMYWSPMYGEDRGFRLLRYGKIDREHQAASARRVMTATVADVYVAALSVGEIFADSTYQRLCDIARARKMAHTWDRRLAGILEVSDRGEEANPRYAVMDGQHRWAAARSLVDPPALVANVHTGLTIADEAALFDKLNRQRKQTNNWDHWKARAAAGDADVCAIEVILCKYGIRIDPGPRDGNLGCTAALEKITKLGGTRLLDDVLTLITGAWQTRRDGLDAPIIHGLAMILHSLRDELDVDRLANTLIDVMPRQLKTQAVSLREMTPGTLPVVTAIVIMGLYNKKPGRKIDVTHKTFGGTGIVNSQKARDASPAPKARDTKVREPSRGHNAAPALDKLAHERLIPRAVPDGLPHYAGTDEQAAAVLSMDGTPVADIATAVGIPERTVRRIRADLGLDETSSTDTDFTGAGIHGV